MANVFEDQGRPDIAMKSATWTPASIPARRASEAA
jgi:hypothetical protein